MPSNIWLLIPRDSGFADGGMGTLRFPFNILAAIFSPWTWRRRFYDKFIFPVLERRRIARGEAPSGYEYYEFSANMTFREVINSLGYGDESKENELVQALGGIQITRIPIKIITEVIRDIQISTW